MARLKLIAGGLVAGLGVVLHLWYRGVLAAPEVKRRKAARQLAASGGYEAATARPEDRPLTRASAAKRA
jgi:hypothetical protein